jgi:hypothetical protein
MDWKNQNGRICAETGRGEPPWFGPRGRPMFCVCPSTGLKKKKAKNGLLVAQGHHGIDFAGAARGNIASGERDQRKQDRDSGEG